MASTSGQDELVCQIASLPEATQYSGHLRQHRIREIDTSRGHSSKESPLCDRRLLGVIANQQTRDHGDGGTSPDLAPSLD